MKQVTVDHAAQLVGVSTATMRNWAKSGHIIPASTRPLSFFEESILELKSKISSQSFDRLKARANKVASSQAFIPDEYAGNSELVAHISNIVACIGASDLCIEPILFLAALRLLEHKGEAQRINKGSPFNIDSHFLWLRKSIKTIMMRWRASLSVIDSEERYASIYHALIPHEGDDFLGLLYQSISREGDKSEQGSYYTPSKLVEDSLSNIHGPIETFLDPCCGTGKYLLKAAQRFKLQPENIFGFDIDRIAANLARLNLLLAYNNREFEPNVYCSDSLRELATGEMFCQTNVLLGKFDAIATNPPWGAYKNAVPINQFYGKLSSGETFSMFLLKSLQLLRKEGQLSFILPESILKIKIHSDIRQIILNESKILRIVPLGRKFSGVFTPVIRLDLIKGLPCEDWMVSVGQGTEAQQIPQKRFKQNEHFTFDIAMSSSEEDLLRKLYSLKHVTLSNNAEWALGIVTGDNKRHVFEKQAPGSEAVYRGSDVRAFCLDKASSFLRFVPQAFQQVAPEKYFRANEKLVYRFISNRLIFAYDDTQALTLNSANILIPSIPGMSIKVVLALLNSSVFQYIFKKKFSTHKVLRGDLERLPFPVIEKQVQSKIEQMVDTAIHCKAVPSELDDIIFSVFNLSGEDILAIKQAIYE